MELREVSPKCRKRHRRFGSGCGKSHELAQRLFCFTAADFVHKGLDRDLGAVADDRIDVLWRDASLAAREQSKLGDLGARQSLIRTEPRHEIAACVAVDLEVCFVELLIDQLGGRALVAVARQRRRRFVAFEKFA